MDELLAEYMQRLNRGEAVDLERFVGEHPGHAGQLRPHFAEADQLEAARGIEAEATTLPPTAQPLPHAESL